VLREEEDHRRRVEDRLADPAEELTACGKAALVDPHGVAGGDERGAQPAHRGHVLVRIGDHGVGRAGLCVPVAARLETFGLDRLDCRVVLPPAPKVATQECWQPYVSKAVRPVPRRRRASRRPGA